MSRAINNTADVWHRSLKPLSRVKQQQAFLKAHSTIQPFWGEVEDISLVSAALLTFGINPSSLDEEFEARGEPVPTDELPDDFLPRIELLRSAVRAGSLTPTTKANDKHGRLDANATRIRTADFITWCDGKGLSHNIPNRQPTLSIAIPINAQADASAMSYQAVSPVASAPSQSPFDPLPLNGIAKMFQLCNDPDKNQQLWRELAHNAKRDGLDSARISVGGGRRQSTFDPLVIADWLVENGRMTREKADRTLMINLPRRSSDIKDLIAS